MKMMEIPTFDVISQSVAKSLDDFLMGPEIGYSIDQLMELAGLSVAQCIYDAYPPCISSSEANANLSNILICCGPGNNGGDGLVAARYLREYGYGVEIYCPRRGKLELFNRLFKQLEAYGISVLGELQKEDLERYDIIVDAIFGFGFSGEVRAPYKDLLADMAASEAIIISVDVPSGWEVDSRSQERGSMNAYKLQPACVVSLSAPKECLKGYTGKHYLGGRFIPELAIEKFNLRIPPYSGSSNFVRLS